MIVDDHDLTLYAIKAVVGECDDIELVSTFLSAEDAIAELESCRPDVVLMDIRMPNLDGIEACRIISNRMPQSRVLMMTHYNREDHFISSIQAGASGYLLKSADSAELLKAIRRVANGHNHLDAEVFGHAFASLRSRDDIKESSVLRHLSKREVQVLILIGKGLSNREIGYQLAISDTTVRNHVTRLFSKTGFTSRTQAAAFAVRHALDELP